VKAERAPAGKVEAAEGMERVQGPKETPRWRRAAQRGALLAIVVFVTGLSSLPAWLPKGAQGEEPDLVTSGRLLRRARAAVDWEEVRPAVEKGLDYLARQQGALGSGAISDPSDPLDLYPVATASLAGLAVLGAGYLPGEGPYGQVLVGCLDYLRACADHSTGAIAEGPDAKSRMHQHCYAVLFLAELLGSLPPEREEDVRALVRAGVKTIERAQGPNGGWYYTTDPGTLKDEASVTICALQALRAARNVGFSVSSSTIDRAISYVKRCQNGRDGSFAYSISLADGARTSYALTVAALSTLNAAGVYRSQEFSLGLDNARRALEAAPSAWRAAEREFEYYANLYAAQVYFQEGGALWDRWFPAVRRHLLETQAVDGFWESRFGKAYATAVALLVLEVPLGYLPLFER